LRKFILQHRLVIVYGISLGTILLVLKWLEYRFIILDHSFEIYIGAIALIFTGLGVWLTLRLSKPKVETIIVEKQVLVTKTFHGSFPGDEILASSGISKREWEVLALMSEGLSNQEIAEKLYVSLNTVKSHSSNLFQKLDVKRRTQATQKAISMGLL
jgi:DNA-binding NarL/FixJ family response regulator